MTETVDIVKNYTEAKDAYIDNVKSYIETILATNFCKHAQVSVKPNYITAELVNAYIYIDFVDDNNEHIFGSDINIRYTEKRPVDFEKLEMTVEMDYYAHTVFDYDALEIERCRAISVLATCLSVIKTILDKEPKEDFIKASIALNDFYKQNKQKEIDMLRSSNGKRNID